MSMRQRTRARPEWLEVCLESLTKKAKARFEGMECSAQEVRWNKTRKSCRRHKAKMKFRKITGSMYDMGW